MRTLTVNANDAGQRLDKFLSKAVRALPQSLMYKLVRTKKIKVNRRRAQPDTRLAEGDTVELFIAEEFFAEDAADKAFTRLEPRLSVVYEDGDILICDKRPGMLCHPDDGEDTDTLIGHIKAYLYRKGEYRPEDEQSFAPALCNRIDRNTGGLVVAAKNAAALRRINQEIKENKVTKRYLCAAHGVPEPREGTLTSYLTKDAEGNFVTVSHRPLPGARTAITRYRVLGVSPDGELSLVECELVTGRTHQIRAQLADLGHPLLGDGKYGVNREDRARGYKYQALYSYKLTLEGKEYSADLSKLWFLKEFPGFCAQS